MERLRILPGAKRPVGRATFGQTVFEMVKGIRMGNFFRMISTRWEREEIASWSSLRKTAYLLLPLLIYFVVHDAAEILLWAGLNGILTGGSEGLSAFLTDNAYTVRGGINGLAILAGVAAIWRAIREEICFQPPHREQLQAPSVPVRSEKEILMTGYMVLGTLAFLSALFLNLLFFLLGFTDGSEGYARTAQAQYGVDFLAGLFLYGILSPVAEEAVFRGLIYNRMKRCFGLLIALVVSSLFFGCYHGNWVQALYGTLLGLLIAWTYERYESFAAPVLFHGVANVSIYAMTYYNTLGDMSRPVRIGVMGISLAGMVVCLWYVAGKAGGRISAVKDSRHKYME